MKNILKAAEFAVRAHMKQVRKGTDIPYVVHPLGVGRILSENKCPDECIIAGILHDTLEDTDITYEDLKEEFGVEVADIVKGASEPDKSDTWENRKKHTIEYLKTPILEFIYMYITTITTISMKTLFLTTKTMESVLTITITIIILVTTP